MFSGLNLRIYISLSPSFFKICLPAIIEAYLANMLGKYHFDKGQYFSKESDLHQSLHRFCAALLVKM